LSAAERHSPDIHAGIAGRILETTNSRRSKSNGQNSGGAFTEARRFAGAGVVTSNAVAATASTERPSGQAGHDFHTGFPATLETLNLGDDISDGASWGNAVHYAGVRWGRNFGLRPDLLTTPLLATSGSATVPSAWMFSSTTNGDEQSIAARAFHHRSIAHGDRHRGCQRRGA